MAGVETLIVGALDLSSIAGITDASGILMDPPISGDLVELDFVAGGQWVPGPPEPYTFDVPLVMASPVQDVAMGQLAQVKALVDGVPRTVTRRYVRDGVTVTETCTGVCSAAVQIEWSFDVRGRVAAVLMIQALSPWVAS